MFHHSCFVVLFFFVFFFPKVAVPPGFTYQPLKKMWEKPAKVACMLILIIKVVMHRDLLSVCMYVCVYMHFIQICIINSFHVLNICTCLLSRLPLSNCRSIPLLLTRSNARQYNALRTTSLFWSRRILLRERLLSLNTPLPFP